MCVCGRERGGGIIILRLSNYLSPVVSLVDKFTSSICLTKSISVFNVYMQLISLEAVSF